MKLIADYPRLDLGSQNRRAKGHGKLLQVRDFGVAKSFHNTVERSLLGSAFQSVHCPPAA